MGTLRPIHSFIVLAVAPILVLAPLAALDGGGAPSIPPDVEPAYVLPSTPVDGSDVTGLLQTLVTDYPDRAAGRPNYIAAQSWIADHLSGLGMQVEVDPYRANTLNGVTFPHVFGGGRGAASGPANVCGYYPAKDLTKRWVVLGGHYDVVETTQEGAYDNGAGTALVMALAEDLVAAGGLADRVLVACLWGGEEDGLIGSSVFVNSLPAPELVQLYVNLDMAGLNWPGDVGSLSTAITYYGPEQINPISGGKMRAYSVGVRTGLGLSSQYFTEMPSFVLTSDNVAFGARNVPYYGFGNFLGSPYPAWYDLGTTCYHQECDTYDNLVRLQGSQALLEDGFQAVGSLVHDHLAQLPAEMEFRVPVQT